MKVLRAKGQTTPGRVGRVLVITVCEFNEATYSGNNMGDRQIVATIQSPTVIDFQINDFIKVPIADMQGGYFVENFYIYTTPTVKKIASSDSVKDAFEYTVTFYPAQYKLSSIKMRDMMSQSSAQQLTAQSMIYTGYDEFSFIGGAHALLDRILYVLNEYEPGAWSYVIASEVDEYSNPALNTYQFDFSDNSALDALQKLNEKDGLNTEWFINGHTIYVGYKKPYVIGFDRNGNLLKNNTPFVFEYGKSSHRPVNYNRGDLFTITKSIGEKQPITRLYAYGSERNVNRFYCADVIRSGRYVNKLMLPSFSQDGKTDYIENAAAIKKYGIREGAKTFDDIFPSLKNITYEDLNQIKYVIKIMGNGTEDSSILDYNSSNLLSTENVTYPIARVQCYKVVDNGSGVNILQEAQPPHTLAVFVHATGKTVKCVLLGQDDSRTQAEYDDTVPTRNGNYIPGSCFCVHDNGFKDPNGTHGTHTTRPEWFAISTSTEVTKRQIQYTDDFWVTDVYRVQRDEEDGIIYDFDSGQTPYFNRDGYSAYCYPRINKNYAYYGSDIQVVNAVVAVGAIYTPDTDQNLVRGRQATFDLYLRDVGFKINEQNPFGANVFIVGGTLQVNFYDGNLGGLSFEVSATNGNEMSDTVVPLYKSDGTLNPDFAEGARDPNFATRAIAAGAFWRLVCKRNTDNDYSWMPNMIVNAQTGDHVVFLDIFMPDIYIRAAENRLLREAQKYLEENSTPDFQYSLELDKVRHAQLQKLGLQMREGVIMRIADSDLEIVTDNTQKTIADYGSAGRSFVNRMETLDVDYNVEVRENILPDRLYYDGAYNSDEVFVENFDVPYKEVSFNDGYITEFNEDIELATITLNYAHDTNIIEFPDIVRLFYGSNWDALNNGKANITFSLLLKNEQNTETIIAKRELVKIDIYDVQVAYDPKETRAENLPAGTYRLFLRVLIELPIAYPLRSNIRTLRTYDETKPSGKRWSNGVTGKISFKPAPISGSTINLKFNGYEHNEVYLPCDSVDGLYMEKPINYLVLHTTDGGTFPLPVKNVVVDLPPEYSGSYLFHATFDLAIKNLINVNPIQLQQAFAKVYYFEISYNEQYIVLNSSTTLAASGVTIPCRAAEPYQFKSGRYYEVSFKIESSTVNMLSSTRQFMLMQDVSRSAIYLPDYKCEKNGLIYKYKFTLPSGFNDSTYYYPVLSYVANSETEEVTITLLSIIERMSSNSKAVIDYIDLAIDSITINLSDNVVDNGLDGYTDGLLRDISVVVKEYKKPTPWSTLNRNIRTNTIHQKQQQTRINTINRKLRKLK